MMKPTWVAVAACIVVAGCNQPRTEEPAGGGGGKAAAPVSDVQRARDRLGEAYVHAARMHAEVVRGDYDGALAAVRDARAELGQAKQAARLDLQARINEADQAAIQVQRDLERRALTSHQATERLVDRLQAMLGAAPPPAAGGGGGAAPGMPAEPRLPAAPAAPPLSEPVEPDMPEP